MQTNAVDFQLLFWAPLGAVLVHIFEEFVWPGGVMRWYRRYRGKNSSRITPRLLIVINALLLAVCVNAAVNGDTPAAIAYWIGVTAILASNGLWHLWAAVRTRGYSPGAVTVTLLYVPLAVYGCIRWLRSSSVSIGYAILALLIGGSYPLWSALFHARSRSTA